MLDLYVGDNLEILKNFNDAIVDLIYVDPPFNTGKKQELSSIKSVNGVRTVTGKKAYDDTFNDFKAFIYPRFEQAYRLLKEDGTFMCHLDYREVHYAKVWLDEIFGRDCFLNEIIWAYDFGARQKNKWATKHDNILIYVKDKNNYKFNYEEIDRIPYMTKGGLVSKEKLEMGKKLTDTIFCTIVPTNSKERTGYPTQKPLKLINQLFRVHSCAGDTILDFFAGSGTSGASAEQLGRNCILIDKNDDAINVMKERFGNRINIHV